MKVEEYKDFLNGFTHLPSFEKISEIENDASLRVQKLAYQAGYISAYELSEVSIDINYSPVIDINHNKKNNLLKGRTFGDNTDNIILLANEYIQGFSGWWSSSCLETFSGTWESHD